MLFLWLGVQSVGTTIHQVVQMASVGANTLTTGKWMSIIAVAEKEGARMSRNHEIRVRVNKDEYDIISLNAEILDMQIAPYIRKVAQNPNITIFDYAAIRAHTQQVGKVVNSINQLVYTIQVTNNYQPKEIEGIRDYVEQILETERKLLREVRKQWTKSVKKG